MEKYFETFGGVNYPIIEIDLSPILEGYGIERIGDSALSQELSMLTKDFTIDDIEATEMDNSIYCYLNTDFLNSDPTEVEILLAIIRQEGSKPNSQQWYNLMMMAEKSISSMYEAGDINAYVEAHRYNDEEYAVYIYSNDYIQPLYLGKDAKVAAITIINALTIMRLSKNDY
jgi:hypothetical protein